MGGATVSERLGLLNGGHEKKGVGALLALLGVWLALCALALATGMLVYRPLFTDLTITAVLWFVSPGALCFAGLVLWAYRKDASGDPGMANQRVQAKVAIAMAVAAAAIVYWLIIFSEKIEPV